MACLEGVGRSDRVRSQPTLWQALPKSAVKLISPKMPRVHVKALRSYIPEAVRKWLELGQMQWLGELRRVTVLFVSLTGLQGLDALEIEDEAVSRVQTTFLVPHARHSNPRRQLLQLRIVAHALGSDPELRWIGSRTRQNNRRCRACSTSTRRCSVSSLWRTKARPSSPLVGCRRWRITMTRVAESSRRSRFEIHSRRSSRP